MPASTEHAQILETLIPAAVANNDELDDILRKIPAADASKSNRRGVYGRWEDWKRKARQAAALLKYMGVTFGQTSKSEGTSTQTMPARRGSPRSASTCARTRACITPN